MFMPVRSILAIALAAATTLSVQGYQFGSGNQAVYLLDGLRKSDPSLLANDWFVTQTLQYHWAFTQLARLLLRLQIPEAGFAVGYAMLIVGLHLAWRGIVGQLGGNDAAYLLSVALYYLCAGGTGLGMYQFLQDSSVLPSNIANVTMLGAVSLWLAGYPSWSGACLGIAGLFHLNHAIVGIILWLALCLWQRKFAATASLMAIVPAAMNIALAIPFKLARSGGMSLEEFVSVYVRLRHPHHYDPSTWPAGLWIAFLCPAIAAIILLRSQARRMCLLFLSLIVVAMLGAGVWFISQTLVQMSLYRFSIYVQLLGCAAAGTWLCLVMKNKRTAIVAAVAGCVAIIAACIIHGPFFGVFRMPQDDSQYLAICRWAAQNTPTDAVFVVPPDEQSMRLIGRRAVVVNYKAVPQLNAELVQWRQRMCDVLDMHDLSSLPRGYVQTLAAIRRRYQQLDRQFLLSVAEKYAASYVIGVDANNRYVLYDLSSR